MLPERMTIKLLEEVSTATKRQRSDALTCLGKAREKQPLFKKLGFVVIALLIPYAGTIAKNKKHSDGPPKDQIAVLAHFPVNGGPVNEFQITKHYSQVYLYVEHQSQRTISLIDITHPDRPTVLADINYPGGQEGGSATNQGTNDSNSGLFRPLHPKVTREFSGVTALATEYARPDLFGKSGWHLDTATSARDGPES